jgi:hypothetical protein
MAFVHIVLLNQKNKDMLSPRLTNCPECQNIPELIKKIDCKLAQLGNNLYNNTVYMLNMPIQTETMSRLINYKRILISKYCNPNYASKYSINHISGIVIKLTAGCVPKCVKQEPCIEEPCNIEIV